MAIHPFQANLPSFSASRPGLAAPVQLGPAFGSTATHKVDLNRFIDTMPAGQRDAIEGLFRYLMLQSGEPFGYSLFGSKPVTAVEIPNGPMLERIFDQALQANEAFEDLGGGQFHLHTESVRLNGTDFLKVSVFNKAATLGVIQRNLSLFQQRLGNPTLTPAGLFRQLCQTHNFFENVLRRDPLLMGILHGYGLDNARRFDSLHSLEDDSPEKKRAHAQFPIWPATAPEQAHTSIKEGKIGLPVFRTIPESRESQRIQERFNQLQPRLQKLIDTKDQKQFLKAVLAAYTGQPALDRTA